MKKNAIHLIFLLPLLYGINACKCIGDPIPDIYNISYNFSLADKQTGQNLLGLSGIYDGDTVKIYDDEKIKVYDGPVPPDGRILFQAVRKEKDAQAFSTEVTRNFYLYLNQFDTDTIKIVFKLKQIKECRKRDDIDYARIYFNDSLYVSGNVLSYSVFLK